MKNPYPLNVLVTLLLFILIPSKYTSSQTASQNQSFNNESDSTRKGMPATHHEEVPEVRIGTQTWMKYNLNVSTFRNGDKIPEAKTKSEWRKASRQKKPVWCYYDNNSQTGNKSGKLYNWYAVSDPRGLAPEGWHIPIEKEWRLLYAFLGEKNGNVAKKLISAEDWGNEKYEQVTEFHALPTGIRSMPIFTPNNGFRWKGQIAI